MQIHRFTLEPYKGMKTRHVCPGCGKKSVFVLYIDNATGQPIAPNVGRCNRIVNCGYHYKPHQHFEDNKHLFPEIHKIEWKPIPSKEEEPISYISPEMLKASRKGYNQNYFISWLQSLFGDQVTSKLVSRYHIGTSKHWPGATVFWQIDGQGRIRTGKIMLFNSTTGKRVRKPFDHITWVHILLRSENFNLEQCYYGEHLLKLEPSNPVAVVESEKTAIIASVYFPQFIWLAVGSLTNINVKKCQPLQGRNVVLFPDLKGFEYWRKKCDELNDTYQTSRFFVSDLLEAKATMYEKESGLDLADYLIKFDFRTFNQKNNILPTIPVLFKPDPPIKHPISKMLSNPMNVLPEPVPKFDPISITAGECFVKEEKVVWNIDELETFFAGIALPTKPFKFNQCLTITDCASFIDNHLSFVKANTGSRAFIPYLRRLQELKQMLSTN